MSNHSPNKPQRICVFIPAFNVENSICRVLDRISEPIMEQIEAVLVIDNNSSDNTLKAVERYARSRNLPKLTVLKNRENYSLGGSTILAFDWAISREHDYLICLHSDGQADAQELTKFFPHCDGQTDFVLGSRMMADSKAEHYSPLRLLGNRFFAWLQQKMTRSKIGDIGAFIAFNLKTVAKLPYDRLPSDMGYQPLLVLKAFHYKRVRFVNVPISWGKVETTHINPWAYAFRHLVRLIRFKMSRHAFEAPRRPVFAQETWISEGRDARAKDPS
jgi:glycosyltransferase involved in cell wall biosynthesis